MSKRKGLFENIDKFCFANCFEFGSLVNTILLYLLVGFICEGIRKIAFIMGWFAFFVVAFFLFLRDFKFREIDRRVAMIYMVFVGFYAVGFTYSFVKGGAINYIVDYLPKFLIISGACFLIGVVGAKRKLEVHFLKYLEKGSFIVLPLATYYAFVHLFNCANYEWNYGADVGPLNYMSLAYLFMPYLLAHLLSFIFENDRDMVVFNLRVPNSQLMRLVCVFIYWIAVLASGTRGAYVSVVCAVVVVIIVALCMNKRNLRVLLPIAIIVFMVFVCIGVRPAGMSRVERWSPVLEGITKGYFNTSNKESFKDDQQLEEYARDREEEIISGEKENSQSEEVVLPQNENVILNREELFKLALYEFKTSPYVGIGPLRFSMKYGTYPHSILLEVFAETGIIGGIVYTGCILYVLLTWVFMRKKSKQDIVLLCFLVSYIAKANISGSLWQNSSVIMFAVAYGTIKIYENKGDRHGICGKA